MAAAVDDIAARLTEHGFRVVYRSAALWLLAHPDLPGVEVRLGTIYLVMERDGREVLRMRLDAFDLAAVLQRARGA